MLFYTVDFEKNTINIERDLLLERLRSFELTTQQGSAQAARSESGQSERYHVFQEDGYTIHFIGIRFNDAGRLIGAIVTGSDEPHYFALEITETHDYSKTLVENETRLNNWKERLLQFIPYLSSIHPAPINEAYESQSTKVKIRYNKLIKLNHQQEALEEAPLSQITFCFGPPGTGKTLIITGFLERCIRANRPTLFMGPEAKLIQFVKNEVNSLLDEEHQALAHFHSWSSFLNILATEANLPSELIYNYPLEKETRKFITLETFRTFYCPSHTPPKAIKSLLKKFSMETLFQEYQHVLLQPTWSQPEQIFLTAEAYCGLGGIQSRIPSDDRLEIHKLLSAFYSHVSSQPNSYYDPVIASKHIYLHLLKSPFKKFGAVAIDESQRFNPLQIACVLSTSTIEEGYALIAADPLQTIDSQPLAFIRPLENYLSLMHVSHLTQLTHLEITHRSSILVTQFTKIWRNMLLRLIGPDELKTFSQMQLDDRQIMGKISIAQYDQNLKNRIESNPQTMVLVPHQNASQNSWATSHLSTINEFQGLSSKTIVLDGLTEVYQNELHNFSKELEEHENPFDLDRPLFPSRHYKSDAPLSIETIKAIKAFIIALSRAEEELILINPHPLLQNMIHYLHQKYTTINQATSEAAEIATIPLDKPSVHTVKQWFNRLKQHINDQLIPQACDLLKRTDIWNEYTPMLNAYSDALAETDSDKIKILQQIRDIIFPPTPSQDGSLAAANSLFQQRQIINTEPNVQIAEDLTVLWETNFKSKWQGFAEQLLTNPSKANLITFFELKSVPLINCILFLPIMNGSMPLMLKCLGHHRNTLKEVLHLKPEIYCSKITMQGVLNPVTISHNNEQRGFRAITCLTEDEGIELFLYMINHNPTLAQQLDGNILCEPFDVVGFRNLPARNQSILHNLCSGKLEQLTLLTLLKQKPTLAKQITALALLREPIVGMTVVAPAIIGLCENREGIEVLIFLLTHHTELINELDPAVLTKPRLDRDKSTNKIYTYTGISLLVTHDIGLIVFNLLLQKNPLFAQLITNEVLDFQISITSKKTKITSLRKIISTPVGRNSKINQCRQEIYSRLKGQLKQIALAEPTNVQASMTATSTHFFRASNHPVTPLNVTELERYLAAYNATH